ncbi:MAG: DUF4153 domain-containing protein [Gemmatimonadota bacterium]
MSRLTRTLRRTLRDAAVALRVAPVEVALGVAMAVTWSLALASDQNAVMKAWMEIATLCLLAGGIAWIATLLHGLGVLSATRRWLLTLAGFAAAVVYDSTLLDFDRGTEGWRATLLVAAVALGITLVPLAATPAGDARDRRFREVNLRLITRVVGVALYAAALYFGLALAISAVNSLFELHLNTKIYGHVFGAIAFGLVPWIVVGGAPAITAPPGPPAEGMRVLRRFGVYLFLPLLAIYYLILYAYMVRIAATGELPRNLVSPLALLAGLIGAVGVMMFAGAGEAGAGEGAQASEGAQAGAAPSANTDTPWAIRMASPLFLPLGILGIWAVGVRVAQYGWTEPRYLRVAVLVALLLLAVLGTWAIVRRRRLLAYPVPLVLLVAALLCALGPWSASAVARRSQQARLAAGLRLADVDTAAVPAVVRSVPDSVYRTIESTGDFLAGHFGNGAVAAVAGHAVVPPERAVPDLAAALGLAARPMPGAARFANARLDGPVPTDALGTGQLYVIERPARHESLLPTGVVGGDSTLLRLELGGRALSADLAGLAAWTLAADSGAPAATARPAPRSRGPRMPTRSSAARLRLEDATLPLRDADGRTAGRFVVRWLNVQGDSTGVRVLQVEGVAVVPPGVSP